MSLLKLLRVASRVPFSHRNGIRTILPGTPFVLELFHTALRLYRLDEPLHIQEMVFQNIGLVDKWTVFFDYDGCQIVAEGSSPSGFFRYAVKVFPDGIYFLNHKRPLAIARGTSIQTVPVKAAILLEKHEVSGSKAPKPFLALGCNKDPLIDRMRERPVMAEILPLLYHQAIPRQYPLTADSLIGAIVHVADTCQRHQILELFRQFWTMALEGNCVPKRRDSLFFGYEGFFVPEELPLQEALSIVSFTIRSLFIREKIDGIYLLPCLPKELEAGRLLDEVLANGHRISFEWRRGRIRRILLQAAGTDVMQLHTGAESCSIRCCTLKNKKRAYNLSDTLAIKSGYRYLFDNFRYVQ